MSLSKKLRFEIFKRDKFSCQYCGRKTPGIVLEIDHILPICKGGKDTKNNLVTSCFECNRGKGARELTDRFIPETLMDGISKDMEHSEQILAYEKMLKAKHSKAKKDFNEVMACYKEITNNRRVTTRETMTIKNFLRKLTKYDVIEALEITEDKEIGGYLVGDPFLYFCGICIRKAQNKEGAR